MGSGGLERSDEALQYVIALPRKTRTRYRRTGGPSNFLAPGRQKRHIKIASAEMHYRRKRDGTAPIPLFLPSKVRHSNTHTVGVETYADVRIFLRRMRPNPSLAKKHLRSLPPSPFPLP